MFGDLRPYREELKLKHIRLYSSYYCALCNQIRKDYGKVWTIFLNYESVYILLLLNSCHPHDLEQQKIRCHINPLMKKKIDINSKLLEYVAFVNMALLELKLEDDEADEKKILARAIRCAINNKVKYKCMHIQYYDLIERLNEETIRLHKLENCNGRIDQCADTTANMLNGIIENWGDCRITENNMQTKLHYYLGKLIYILDAYEDLEMDSQNNNFNPIITMVEEDGIERAIKKVDSIIDLLLFLIRRQAKLFEIDSNKELIDNILTYGIDKRIRDLKGKKENVYRKSVRTF